MTLKRHPHTPTHLFLDDTPNYLLMNPIKHGYVTDLRDYPFSSFHTLLADMGRERLVKQIRDYPDYKHLVLHEAEEDDF